MTLACQDAGSIMPGTGRSLVAWGNGGVIITDGTLISISLRGHVLVDVCAALS